MAFATSDAAHISKMSPLFEGLDEADIRAIVARSKCRHHKRGQIILQAPDAAIHLYLLLSGCARHYRIAPKGKRLLIRWIRAGTPFGLQTLTQKRRMYGTNVEMVEEGDVLVWDRETAQQLAYQYPRVFGNALTLAMDYVDHYHSIHLGLTSRTAEQRLAQALLEMSESLGEKTARGTDIDVKNKHLADMANVNFFTASRILSAWRKKGLIAKSRGNIVIRSQERRAALL